MTHPTTRPRRGWREKIEPGIRRAHRVDCPSTSDRRAGRRCKCDAYEVIAPGVEPGATCTVTVPGSITEARRHRHQLLAAGRPEPPPPVTPDAPADLTALAVAFFRTREPVLSGNTIRNYAVDYRYRIGPHLGAVPLDQMSRHVCEIAVADLAAEYAAGAISYRVLKGTVTTLRAILSKGVEWGHFSANPASRLTLPPHDTAEDSDAGRVLTQPQLQHLLLAGSDKRRVRTMLRGAAEGGLRRGEICGLRWSDVDLTNGRLNIRRSYDGPPKGRRSRTISSSADFVACLAAWCDESMFAGAAADGFVWPGKAGGPMHEHTPTQTCTRAMTRAGLVDGEGMPLVTLHGLQHTCASLMLMRGVPLIVVSRHLGHADVNITARTYAHLVDDAQLGAAADAFQLILAASDTLGGALGDTSLTA